MVRWLVRKSTTLTQKARYKSTNTDTEDAAGVGAVVAYREDKDFREIVDTRVAPAVRQVWVLQLLVYEALSLFLVYEALGY